MDDFAFPQQATQDAVNARVYHAHGVDRIYHWRTLTVVETTALLKYQPAFAGRDVLDVGVGTGRISAYLAPLARRYEGVDYSPVMVKHLHQTMPEINVRLTDMRDLTDFSDASFDFVLMPDNVIDAVGHEDRERTLREMRRVLRSGGTLLFSSHNRRYQRALDGPRLAVSRNPATQLANVVYWLRQLANHRRVGRLRVIGENHALLNDEGHDFACLHYYIDHSSQRRQLAELGFEVVEVFDEDARSLAPDEQSSQSPSLTYVARAAKT